MSKTVKLLLLFIENFSFSTRPSISYNIIWNNKDIKIDNKTIYYSNYIKAGILLINHLQFNKNNIESFNSAKSKGLNHSNFLVWSGVRAAVPAHLKSLDVIESELECPLEFHCGEKDNEINICLENWKHRLGLENARAALCKLAACTRQTLLSKTFTKLA